MEIRIEGGRELAALARRLKQAGDKGLQRELSKAINRAAKPVRAAIKQSALDTLPRRGGLAQGVAGSRIRVRRAGSTLRVVVTNEWDIEAMDRGIVFHRTFGRPPVHRQAVPRGWWSRPVAETGDTARTEIIAAMRRVAKEIEG